MKFIYPAVFTPASDGTWRGAFPDLAGCGSTGETLDEAIENANAAAADWIGTELEEDVPALPPVSDAEDLTLEKGQIVRRICVNIRFYEGWDE